MTETISFSINGKTFEVSPKTVSIDTSLNTYIRSHANLTGTKFMCLEGGCGVCIVTARGIHPVTKQLNTWAVNSCLIPVFSCHGLAITTIEGVGNKKDGYHPAQQRLTQFNGTQCGYCSPGMVMNMYSLLEAKDGRVSMKDVENSFGGNICRCTGYRPILDAFKSLAYDADEKLLAACRDIEDLGKICPKTGSACSQTCKSTISNNNVQLTFDNGKRWLKVSTLQEIFTVFDKIPATEPYMLVAGNTAHGVYRRSVDIKTFIDITAVKELHENYMTNDALVVGGSVSLTELMDILTKASKTAGYEYVTHLVNHIDLIANVPVRNVGTIAGNLSIKHARNEFPSDMFIILDGIDAKLTIANSKIAEDVVSMVDYLKLDMTGKIILNVKLPVIDPSKYYFRSYKIMPRAQNAHAYVNAAFLIKHNRDVIESARICYGGISPEFNHALNTEKMLRGKRLHTNDTLQSVLQSLDVELQPDWELPDASPEYRRQLAYGIFYKFFLNTSLERDVAPKYLSGGQILSRPLSSGIQTFDTYEDKWPLTKYVPKYEGLIQSSGEAKYSNDFPTMPNELWAAFVPATKVHAKLIKIDPTAALNVPGVHYFFSAKDIPGVNDFTTALPGFPPPNVEEIFLSENNGAGYYGQPVGIILADSFSLANYAANLVSITYGEKVRPEIITNLHDAFAKKATDRYKKNIFNMTASRVGEESTKKVRGKFEMGAQYHYTMESQTTLCVPAEDGLDIYCATQWVDNVQVAVSRALAIPNNAINMKFKRLGGAYGAKISRPAHVATACALACYLLNRPVRFVMTIESNMATMGKRIALLTDYDIDVDDNGKIQKMDNNYYQDSGCNYNEDPEFSTIAFFKNCYMIDTWNAKSHLVLTDASSHTWCRAPGTTEGIAMIEHMMEHIARVTGKDPLKVRLANMKEDHHLRPILANFLEENEYYKRKSEIEAFNSENRWRKRGIAIVPMQYSLDFFGSIPAYVAIYQGDGTVVVEHGGVEMGQGINTKIAQVTAHLLGVPLKHIKIKEASNVVAANAFCSGGSMTSEAVCFAVKKSCEELLERMRPVREELKDPAWIDIVSAYFAKNIDLTAKYMYRGSADIKGYEIWGVTAAEVEIDVLTGSLQLRRVDILEDTGESLSPSVDIGQVEGSFIMGVGYWLTEAIIYHNDTGELLTNRTWTYKPPGAKDIPIDFRVTFLQKSSNSNGVLRSKATGEPPLCMSIVVLFALRHALESARKDAGLIDWFDLDGPATPDVILVKAGNSFENYKLN